jgi:hypothetical protein
MSGVWATLGLICIGVSARAVACPPRQDGLCSVDAAWSIASQVACLFGNQNIMSPNLTSTAEVSAGYGV